MPPRILSPARAIRIAKSCPHTTNTKHATICFHVVYTYQKETFTQCRQEILRGMTDHGSSHHIGVTVHLRFMYGACTEEVRC